eukprot:5579934-Amphidinium_carterae.1
MSWGRRGIASVSGREYPMPGASSGARQTSSTRQRQSHSRPQNAGFHGKAAAAGSSQRAASKGAQPPKQRQHGRPPPPSNGKPPVGSGLAAARHSRGSPLPEWGSPGAKSY